MSSYSKIIETPLGAVLILVISLILAGLTVAAAISGQLTAAAVKLKRFVFGRCDNPIFSFQFSIVHQDCLF